MTKLRGSPAPTATPCDGMSGNGNCPSPDADLHPEVPRPLRRFGNTKSGPPTFWQLTRSKEQSKASRQLAMHKHLTRQK